MLKNKRFYERLKTNVPCIVYKNGFDVCATIKNLSENGMYIVFDNNYEHLQFKIGDKFKIQIFDTIDWNGKKEERIMVVDANIVHASTRKKHICIGCSVSNYRYEKYVLDKKTANFMKVCTQHRGG